MNAQTVRQKLLRANFIIYWERPSPNGSSIVLFLDCGDRVIIEDNGSYTVMGDNKDKINEVLSHLSRREIFSENTKALNRRFSFRGIVKYLGSAVAGGIIGNRADKQLDNILPDAIKETTKPTTDGLYDPDSNKYPMHLDLDQDLFVDGQADPTVRTGTVVEIMHTTNSVIMLIKPDDGSIEIRSVSPFLGPKFSIHERVVYNIGANYQAKYVRRYII